MSLSRKHTPPAESRQNHIPLRNTFQGYAWQGVMFHCSSLAPSSYPGTLYIDSLFGLVSFCVPTAVFIIMLICALCSWDFQGDFSEMVSLEYSPRKSKGRRHTDVWGKGFLGRDKIKHRVTGRECTCCIQ